MQYPEFLLAGVAGTGLLVTGIAGSGQRHCPAWASEPAAAVVASLPARYRAWIGRSLVWAGYRHPLAFGDFASIKVYAAIASLLLAAVLPVALVLLVAGSVFFIPDAALLVLVSKRQLELRRSLPQALDLMVLCVDAGLGLDATIQRIATERTAVARTLNEELLHLGRDILLGMDRERAYQELYGRTGVEELKTLGSALNQAGKLGIGIARTLRSQSDFLRMKQSQKAEEKAFKLPILMAFPLWFCIMPALMIIVLAPSLIMFFQQVRFQPGLFQ